MEICYTSIRTFEKLVSLTIFEWFIEIHVAYRFVHNHVLVQYHELCCYDGEEWFQISTDLNFE